MNRAIEGATDKPQRKIRSDKKVPVQPSISQFSHSKLQRLALACGVSKTKLAEEILELVLDSPNYINYLQDLFNAGEFRVIPMAENGTVVLVSANGN